MGYTRHQWADNNVSSPYGPISAARLTEMENGIFQGATVVTVDADNTGATDCTDAVRAAYAAAKTLGGIVYFQPGTYLMNKTGATSAVVLDPTAKSVAFIGAGRGATTIKLSANTISFISGDVGTGNTVPDLLVEDMTFDMNSQATNTTGGIIYTMFSAVNIGKIIVRRCNTINVGTSTTQAGRRGVDVTLNVTGAVTTYTINKVLVEDCQFNGGNTGVLVQGYVSSGGSSLAQLVTSTWPSAFVGNATADTVIINRCFHDTLITPTSQGTGSNFMVGQYLTVTRAVLEDLVGRNSVDDGIEVDSIIDCTIERCDMSGAFNEDYFFSNLNGMPCDPDQQRIRLRDCRGGIYFNTLGIPAGHIHFENCDGDYFNLFGNFKSITLDSCSYLWPNGSPEATFGYTAPIPAIQLALLAGRGVVRINDFKYAARPTVDGTPGGGFGFYPIMINALAEYEMIADGVAIKATPTLTNGAKSEVGAILFFQNQASSNFMADPLSGSGPWPGDNYITDAGSATDLTVGSNKLVGNLNLTTEKRFAFIRNQANYQWGLIGPTTDVQMQVEGRPGSTLSGWKLGAIAKRVDANNYLEGSLSDNGTTTTLHLDAVVGGTRTALAAPITTTRVSSGTTSQIFLTVLGDTVTVAHEIAGVTQQSLTASLNTAQVKAVGSAVQGYSGFSWIPQAVDSQVTTIQANRRSVLKGTLRNIAVKEAVTLAGSEFNGSYGFPWEEPAIARVDGYIRATDCDFSKLDGAIKLSSASLLSQFIILDKDSNSSPVVFSKSGVLAVSTGAGRFPCPANGTIVGVLAAVGTAPTGASLITDVKKNGTTIFTTQANRPTIAASSTTSAMATPDVIAVAPGDLLSVDVDQVGSTIAGSDLSVVVFVRF